MIVMMILLIIWQPCGLRATRSDALSRSSNFLASSGESRTRGHRVFPSGGSTLPRMPAKHADLRQGRFVDPALAPVLVDPVPAPRAGQLSSSRASRSAGNGVAG
jgi:hypothetical protein